MSNVNVAQCKLNAAFLPFTLTEVLKSKKGCRDVSHQLFKSGKIILLAYTEKGTLQAQFYKYKISIENVPILCF